MTKFTYHNSKNAGSSYMPLEFNYCYYPHIFFKENTDPYFYSKVANK